MNAGLSAGDRIIAINNIEAKSSTIYTQIQSYAPGDVITVHAFRRDELMTVDVTLVAPPKTVAYIDFAPFATEEQKIRRAKWLEIE